MTAPTFWLWVGGRAWWCTDHHDTSFHPPAGSASHPSIFHRSFSTHAQSNTIAVLLTHSLVCTDRGQGTESWRRKCISDANAREASRRNSVGVNEVEWATHSSPRRRRRL